MPRKVALAFELEGSVLPLDKLLPLRKVTPDLRGTAKYRRILASLREVGLIEPLIVFPQKDTPGTYLLLDGLLRWDALKAMGEQEAFCLIATDDESYTYNHKVNQVSAIQETFMIRKALERGVPEARIASALNIDVATLRKKRNLLEGICPEAVELLKDSRASAAALGQLKRVIPARQVEMVELMLAMRNFSTSSARCMYMATPHEQRLDAEPDAKEGEQLTPEEAIRLRREMDQLHRDLRAVEESHGETALNLVLAVGYVKTLLVNARVLRHLGNHHSVIVAEFKKIVQSPDLDAGEAV